MQIEDSLIQLLLQLEMRLLQSEVRHSPAELSRLLADEFIEIGSSGHIYDKKSIIEALIAENGIHFSISEFRARLLAPEIVLVNYKVTASSPKEGSAVKSLRSSIWKKSNGSWKMVFHQGTPVP